MAGALMSDSVPADMGFAVAYDRGGVGEPLVLLPGTGCTSHYWGPLRTSLAAQRDVIAVDLPGFGESPPLPGDAPATAARLASAVAALLDSLGIHRAHLVGNSLGGQVAFELARAGRGLSVCALSPTGFWTDREQRFCAASIRFTEILGRRLVRLPAWLAGGVLTRIVFGFQLFARPWRVPRQEFLDILRRGAASSGLPGILAGYGPLDPLPDLTGIPVTIAWGQRDRLLPGRQARRAEKLLPQARHVRLRRCGHIPMWDDPDQVAAAALGVAG
jgi:pimeloyl-ACP methyl ester carboxylesterase